MLSPYERTALFDALRPPPGYVLDQAVGTSFTLDLEALLTGPARSPSAVRQPERQIRTKPALSRSACSRRSGVTPDA